MRSRARGWILSGRVRRDGPRALKVVMLTAREDEIYVAVSLEVGADDYITN
jgi:DNA-binding response OmpR family regulator